MVAFRSCFDSKKALKRVTRRSPVAVLPIAVIVLDFLPSSANANLFSSPREFFFFLFHDRRMTFHDLYRFTTRYKEIIDVLRQWVASGECSSKDAKHGQLVAIGSDRLRPAVSGEEGPEKERIVVVTGERERSVKSASGVWTVHATCVYNHLVPVSTDFNSKSSFFFLFLFFFSKSRVKIYSRFRRITFRYHVTLSAAQVFAIPAFNVRRLTFRI